MWMNCLRSHTIIRRMAAYAEIQSFTKYIVAELNNVLKAVVPYAKLQNFQVLSAAFKIDNSAIIF